MRKLILLLLTLFMFVSPTAVLAAPFPTPLLEDKVVFGGTYTLESGDELDGNLLVLGGVVNLEENSLITGDVLILGGNVVIDGSIGASLVAIGGVVSLSDTVTIQGDLIAPATVVRRSEGARILGQTITDAGPFNVPVIPDAGVPEPPSARIPFDGFDLFAPVLEFMGLVLQSLLFSTLAVVILLIAPKTVERVRNAARAEPVLSGGFGFFTQVVLIAAFLFLGLLSILVITIPFTVLGIVLLSLGFLIAGVLGWFAIGTEVGQRVAEYFKQDWTVPLQAGVGTFTITMFSGLFGVFFLDFIGGLFTFILIAVGLGAVLLTRFGTRDYVPNSAANAELAE